MNRKEEEMNNSKTLTAIALVLALAPAVATAKPDEPAGKQVGVPAVAPVEMNLGAEWKVQFEDLRVQIAEHPRLLEEMARKKHVLEEQVLRPESLILPADRDAVDIVLRRTEALLREIRRLGPKADLSAVDAELRRLKDQAGRTSPEDGGARYELFVKLCEVRRRIALANPLLDFTDVVFIKRTGAPDHCCDQYFGFANGEGGGLFVLENAFGPDPRLRDLLAEATVMRGRLKGQKLARKAFLSPALSYDARTILFAYAEKQGSGPQWSEGRSFHIFKINADGTQLEQLTDGPWNDFDPCFMPDGRVVFISERRGGFGRCHGRPVPTYTLHSMNLDGSDIVCLSYHETNEWNPSVSHDGMVLYTRWDYVDRGFGVAHHPWVTRPDGTDARAIHGNYPRDQERRPNMEAHVRAVPGSHRYLATACAHHGASQGSLILVDPAVKDDQAMAPVRRITPEMVFPESESFKDMTRGMFATGWPLSEDFYLAVYEPRCAAPPKDGRRPTPGLYLVDSFGNRELLYRDPAIRCWNPIPVKPRPVPPVVPPRTADGRRIAAAREAGAALPAKQALAQEGTVALMNVYDGSGPWPKDTRITALRVVQLFPRSTPLQSDPEIGRGAMALARGVLGTVPVEEDGSAHFFLPAGKAVYFQALDERGLAVQSMMSDTYVHAGERLVCQGCHEPAHRAPIGPAAVPAALRRAPSRLKPEVDGAWPLSFPRLVQPVLDRRCAGCHAKEPKAPSLKADVVTIDPYDSRKADPRGWSEAYWTLRHKAWSGGGNWSTPGRVGARVSGLLAMFEKGQGHHDVKLSPGELHRLTLWLDCNSNFFGAYEQTQEQARGAKVLPALE